MVITVKIPKIFSITCGFILMSYTAFADEPLPPLVCEGNDPDWQLSLLSDSAQFTFGKFTEMEIPQSTTAQNAPFPRAYTLVGGRDTAIVILNERRCDTDHVTAFPFEANILTQKGETPVILRGCCTVTE